MGSQGSSKQIEDTVGGLVWIRRRNGSWWPGRIMGLHELPASCLVSPRSGTPVKLLGREDASVDWYNLEKSKRVKAFRCGEYDECIEKAKASASNANKKAVKYARREDAILHALELESAHESGENHVSHSKDGRSTCKRRGLCIRKPSSLSTSDSEDGNMDSKETAVEANLTKEVSQSGLTFEDPSHVSTMQAGCLQRTRRKTPNDSEDDGSEGTRRMRGLEDLGMQILCPKKANLHSDSEESDKLVLQDSASEPNVCSSVSSGSPVNRSMDSCSYGRKRPAQVPLAHENLKRKNRCRPLKKVLESTTMVSVPVRCDQGVNPGQSILQGVADSNVPALEVTDSKKPSIPVVINNNGDPCDTKTPSDASLYSGDVGVEAGHILSDPKGTNISTILEFPDPVNDDSAGLFDVPFIREKTHTEDTHENLQSANDSGNPSNHSKDGLDNLGSPGYSVDISSLNLMMGEHASKWQSKGKRNSRTQSHRTTNQMAVRKSVDRDSESDISLNGKCHRDGYGFVCKVEPDTFDQSLDLENCGRWSSHVSESSYLDSINYGKQNLSIRDDIHQPKDRKLDLSLEKNLVAKPAKQVRNKELYLRDDSVSPLIPHRSLPYRQSRFNPHSKYQDAYVPSRHIFENSSLFDVNLEARASYPGPHVPLVSLMSKLNGKAIVGHPVTVEVCEDGSSDLLLNGIDHPAGSSDELYEVPGNVSDQSTDVAGISLFQSRYGRVVDSPQTDTGHKPRPTSHSKSSASRKKSSKSRKSGNLSKKTRKLSSFVAPSRRDQDRKPVVEKLGVPVIACVPLNIVFSRINEALSGRSTCRKSTLGFGLSLLAIDRFNSWIGWDLKCRDSVSPEEVQRPVM